MDDRIILLVILYFTHCYCENQCLGSGCFCTEYPVHIRCTDGYPEYIPDMIKRMAVTITIDGDSFDHVELFDIAKYISLRKIDVNVNDDRVCHWLNYQRKIHPTVTFKNVIACIESPSTENIDETIKETSNGENTFIKMTTGQFIGWITFSLIIVIGFIARKKM